MYHPQKRIPVESWPWKLPRSHHPKCDFYLPEGNIYIEVKGFMTIQAMAKLSWFCRQKDIRYYILQGTEEDWNPYINSPLGGARGTMPDSNQNIRVQNILYQVKELNWLTFNDPDETSSLSLARLKAYIATRISEYEEWNEEWY